MANKDPRMRAKPSKTAAAQWAASKVTKRSSELKPVTERRSPYRRRGRDCRGWSPLTR